MSLLLQRGTKPDGLRVTAQLTNVVSIGNYEISLDDFLIVAEYVLTNTDLVPNDHRLQFVKCVKSMKEVKGYNKGRKRLESSLLPIPES